MSRRNDSEGFVASLAMVVGISLSAGAQTPDRPRTEEELTLEEARARALDSAPELRAAAAHLAAVEGALQQARALPNPDLSFEVEDFGGNLPADVPSQQTLSIGQRVEWFGKRSARVEAARLEREVAAFDLARRRRDVGHEVERRFAALLGAQERLAIADESTATAREVRAAVAALVSAGEVSPIEETRVLGDEALAGIDRDGAARDVADAARALSQLWGDATGSTPRAAGRLAQTAPLLDRDAALGGACPSPRPRAVGRRDRAPAGARDARPAGAPPRLHPERRRAVFRRDGPQDVGGRRLAPRPSPDDLLRRPLRGDRPARAGAAGEARRRSAPSRRLPHGGGGAPPLLERGPHPERERSPERAPRLRRPRRGLPARQVPPPRPPRGPQEPRLRPTARRRRAHPAEPRPGGRAPPHPRRARPQKSEAPSDPNDDESRVQDDSSRPASLAASRGPRRRRLREDREPRPGEEPRRPPKRERRKPPTSTNPSRR